jgi:hypothetical protein
MLKNVSNPTRDTNMSHLDGGQVVWGSEKW